MSRWRTVGRARLRCWRGPMPTSPIRSRPLALVHELLQARSPLDVAGPAIEMDVGQRLEGADGLASALRTAVPQLQGQEPVEQVHDRDCDEDEPQEHDEREPLARGRLAAKGEH